MHSLKRMELQTVVKLLSLAPIVLVSAFARSRSPPVFQVSYKRPTSDDCPRGRVAVRSLPSGPIGLWLDLRGTAITPKTALLHLDSPLPIDKVVVSQENAPRALQLCESGDPDMIYVDKDSCILCDSKDPFIQYGIVVSVDDSSFVNPIPALTTTSEGGWVLVDSATDGNSSTERYEALTSLVDFLVGGASFGGRPLSIGIDSSFDGDVDISRYSNEEGGVAIACQTKSDVVQAANLLTSIYDGAVVTTDSGILLKVSVDSPTGSSAPSQKLLQSALLLPFDGPIWETAALVLTTTES